MKVFKKLTVVLLSLAMVLTVIPNMTSMRASAASGKDAPVEALDAIVAESEESEQKTLQSREEAAKNNTVEVTKGSDKGFVLENGKTYVFKQNVKFTNNTAGGSAITVPENSTAIFQIEKGVTVTAIGADGYLSKGAGAGINVPETATLIVKGEGTLKATGGNATGGENGSNGESAKFDKNARGGAGLIYGGHGGSGGFGGGGAGAGIGGKGGNGGKGGKRGIFGGGGHTLGESSTVSGLALLSSEEGFDKEKTSNLFDNKTDTKYCQNVKGTISIYFKSSEYEKATSYSLTTANDTDKYGRFPDSWVLYGSNDTLKWNVMDTVKAPNMTKNNFKEFTYSVDNVGEYKYYRIDFTANDIIQFSELKLYKNKEGHPASATDPVAGDCNGAGGEKGTSGENGEKCGTVYVLEKATVIAAPGKDARGKGGKAGSTGSKANDSGSGYNNDYTAGAGAGGGGGAYGLAPEYGIGSGGAGGAGGGGGGAGSSRVASSQNYGDDGYARGGTGGNGGEKGSAGRSFGSQKGGNGGDGGARVVDTTVSGNVCIEESVTVEGRLDGDMQKGVFSINDDGSVVNLYGESITDVTNLTLENNKLYRFDKSISYTAPGRKNAITIPDNSKIIFEIPAGIKVELKGGKSSSGYGAGAGIYVPESSILIIRGSGTLNAAGGDADDGWYSYAGGGAGAGIGGAGLEGAYGNKAVPDRGTNCGTVYIMGSLTLNATSGKAGADSNSYTGGRAADYGIGGGGAGGNKKGQPMQLSGKNGDIFIDYASVNVKGRDAFYHRADLSVDIMGDVNAAGYTDMILGNRFSDGVTTENLYIALREVANRNALKKGEGWIVVTPNDSGNETNGSCNGAYKNGNEWNKNLIDESGGYVYLFATYLGRYVKTIIGDNDDPKSIINRIWADLKDKFGNSYISDDMKTLMHEILFYQHYGEPFGYYRDDCYTVNNRTSGSYTDADDALKQIDYSYTTVLDSKTARYLTISYDTYRDWKYTFPVDVNWYYKMGKSTFTCIDGYKGVTMKNWMKYIPQNASVAQLNMPGSHDSGTYKVGLNEEMIDVIANNFASIYGEKVPWWGSIIAVYSPEILPTIPLLAPLATVAVPYVLINMDEIIQYFIDSIAQCNNLTIEQQLNAGLRTFDIRMIYDPDKKIGDLDNRALKGSDTYYEAGFLKICHGTLAEIGFDKYADHDVSMADGHNPGGSLLTFKNVIEDCLGFLQENKSESVYLTYKCEGNNKDGNYTKAINKVLSEAEKDPRVLLLKKGDRMPTVGEAAGKLYLIESHETVNRENDYDVSASKKIELLKNCFKESQSNKLRQDYSKAFNLRDTRMIYSSTYDMGINLDFFTNPWKYDLLSGTPKEIAIGLGNDSVNHYLDTYGYQRGQYYGWVYMNFPTQMATSNLVFSNIFDTDKLVKESLEGSIFTPFNIAIFTGGIVALLVPAITIPLVKKRKGKKGKKGEDATAES